MVNNGNDFKQITQGFDQDGIDGVLEVLETTLRRDKKYHELFEALKIKVRHQLGLPLHYSGLGDDLTDTQREALENGLLEACRDVGMALLQEGKIREAWMYLRPIMDREGLIKQLDQIPVNDENREEMIELTLQEGLDVSRGFSMVLEHYGTCNAITTFQSFAHGKPRAEIQGPAGLLVRHVYEELKQSVRGHIEREESTTPQDLSLSALIAGRDWLFGEYSYHVDASHLSSTMQAARCLDDPSALRLALEMSEYGSRLHPQFQYPGEEPFSDTYPSHRHYFRALLGEDQDEALSFFEEKARTLDAYEQGTGAIETYLDLLARVGRFDQAIQGTIELIPPNVHTTGLAPELIELARRAENYDPVLDHYRSTGNLLAFATSLMQSKQQQKEV